MARGSGLFAMNTYLPWSTQVLDECLRVHDAGGLPTLDIELTAKCTFASCIYCDSKPAVGEKHPNELTTDEILHVIREASDRGLQWVYSCGLGEPMEDDKLRAMIDGAWSIGVRFSLFTNAIGIDRSTAKWLHQRGVCLIVKLDSLDEGRFDAILGVKGAARKVFNAIDDLLIAGYGDSTADGLTNLAFSIVPTSINLRDIPDVVGFAGRCNAFPSVGELEQAGRVMDEKGYHELAVEPNELDRLKVLMEQLQWQGYTRPVCPTIITGLHLDNIGNCVVDADTGLNCKWFMLREPRTRIIGNVRESSLVNLLAKVMEYRQSCFQTNVEAISECRRTNYVFGGCGGSPTEVIRISEAHYPLVLGDKCPT